MTFDIGDMVRLTVEFLVDEQNVDPSTLTFKLKSPDGTITTYVFGAGSDVVKDAVGHYHVDYLTVKSGTHTYHWQGTGTAQSALEGAFFVQPSQFP